MNAMKSNELDPAEYQQKTTFGYGETMYKVEQR
jgi:hypothetical protein